ncbi:uncharacterized protein LOC120164505 isoform X2 [Hibiscus syriacus]|uniref:uncharacterized protein LOC120164505 isoform X2 n=1 Tax=Hibiscus syriacus TaxID=106335 RepID=UPI0019233750|nr:uncharacterized protein LOC120164505 isoform X2 [Hibiscus syriacus]
MNTSSRQKFPLVSLFGKLHCRTSLNRRGKSKNLRPRMKRLQTEMEEISREQRKIKEEHRQLREKFEAVEMECEQLRKKTNLECEQLRKKTNMIMQQSMSTNRGSKRTWKLQWRKGLWPEQQSRTIFQPRR